MGKTQEVRFTYSIPDLLVDKVVVSKAYQNYTSRGYVSSYGVDLEFPEMGFYKTLKSSDFYLLRGKIEATFAEWEKKYKSYLIEKHKNQQKKSVDDLTLKAQKEIDNLYDLLSNTLKVNDAVNWDVIKRKDLFKINPNDLCATRKVPEYITFNTTGCPVEYQAKALPRKPNRDATARGHGVFNKLFRKKKIQEDFEQRMQIWENNIKCVKKDNVDREKQFTSLVNIYQEKEKEFELEKVRDNNALEETRRQYQAKDPKAIEEYCDLVLNNSQYPNYFPKNWNLEFQSENGIVIVEYMLPSPEALPSIVGYGYIKSKDEITEKHMPKSEYKQLYDDVIYQICLRTIHELFEADVVNALEAVAFNGIVANVNPATGKEEMKVIMSIMTKKDEFMMLNLAQVNPKATFKHLKGISAPTLIDLTPIPPIIKLETADKRFIEGREVADVLDESVNIAAMPWEDFEHLVRELFEKEFSSTGGEVKVTRASADGGVDAVIFDPDPIRGGKIVVQAKRYTNVVGVAHVRDLWGTVMNEGAIKGILVTTSNYGKDSYEFAKNKPITLINGNHLLSLLAKHGHKARINIAEAKKMLEK